MKVPLESKRLTWAASAVLHAMLIAVAVTTSWRIDREQVLITIVPPSAPRPVELPPFGGTKRGPGPSGGLGRPMPSAAVRDTLPPAPAPIGKPDTTLAGRGFGAGGEGFFRIALTVAAPRLVEAAERLGRVLAAV